MELDYEELLGWMEYFRRRPVGWRADNRAAIIAMSSMGGGKLKPEDLFDSLRVLKTESSARKEDTQAANFAAKFFDKFSARFTEENPFNND